MAAISTTLLTLLKTGDHMLVQESLYGGSEIFFTNDLPDWGITFTRVNADKPDTWAAAIKSSTKVMHTLIDCHVYAMSTHTSCQRLSLHGMCDEHVIPNMLASCLAL